MAKSNTAARSYLPPRNISFFCLQISDLLSAGVPLDEGLSVMLEDADSAKEKALLTSMRDSLEDHTPLSRILLECGLFPPYVVRMAEVGESTGRLDQIMKELSVYYEKEDQIKKSLKNAVTYPCVMVIIMLLVLFLLAVEVMPVFEGVFAQLGASFTPFTRGLIRGVGILSGAGLALIALAGVAFLVLWLIDRARGGVFDRFRVLFLDKRKLFQEIGVNRFANILSMALKSGMDVDQGAEMAAGLVANKPVEDKIRVCMEETASGKSFTEAVKKAGLFSAMHRQIIQVGMRIGNLDEAMERISQDCEAAVDERVSHSLARLEPTLTAALSLVAGGILILVMMPLIGILSSMG